MKTPHRLIHDAKEAGVITEEEWKAFMRARNEVSKEWREEHDVDFYASETAANALEYAFDWRFQYSISWSDVLDKIDKYEYSKQEAKQ